MLGVIKSGYTLKVENFEGPLDLLLELIHNSRLSITDIALSDITDQYLMYLKTLQLFNIDIASEFFVIAATLVYQKTRKLLPVAKADEEEILDEHELIERLKTYKKFKFVARFLWKKKEEGDVYYSRGFVRDPIGGRVKVETEPAQIGDILQVIARYKGAFIRKAIPIKRREVNVEQKMSKIMQLLHSREAIRFSEVTVEEATKVDKVASFLGGLELSFRQQIYLKQPAVFRDIDMVRRASASLIEG